MDYVSHIKARYGFGCSALETRKHSCWYVCSSVIFLSCLRLPAVPLLLEISDPDSVSSDRTMHPHTFMPTYEPRVRTNRRKPFEPKWDPALLQYSPRIRPPSTNPHPSTLQRPPPEPSFWPGPEEARQWSDDLNRFTEREYEKPRG